MDTIIVGCVIFIHAAVMVTSAPVTARFVGGVNDREGRVEVLHQGAWNTVCSAYWSHQNAMVLCTQLGFKPDARTFLGPSPYGPGAGAFWSVKVNCTGSELTLQDCARTPSSAAPCSHHDDVGVVCLGVGEAVRLSGGLTGREGRVELTYQGRWGTVCDDAWDVRAAAVVCQMLGYEPAAASRALTSPVPFERSRAERIWLDDVICGLGGEQCLSQCGSLGWGIHDCTHYEDAGVICLGELGQQAPATPPEVTSPRRSTAPPLSSLSSARAEAEISAPELPHFAPVTRGDSIRRSEKPQAPDKTQSTATTSPVSDTVQPRRSLARTELTTRRRGSFLPTRPPGSPQTSRRPEANIAPLTDTSTPKPTVSVSIPPSVTASIPAAVTASPTATDIASTPRSKAYVTSTVGVSIPPTVTAYSQDIVTVSVASLPSVSDSYTSRLTGSTQAADTAPSTSTATATGSTPSDNTTPLSSTSIVSPYQPTPEGYLTSRAPLPRVDNTTVIAPSNTSYDGELVAQAKGATAGILLTGVLLGAVVYGAVVRGRQ